MHQQTEIVSKDKKDDDGLDLKDLKPSMLSTPFAIFILVFCTLILCLIVVLNVVIDTPLFIQGLNFIFNYQNSQPAVAIRVIQNLFSLLCNPIGIGVMLLIYYIVVNRKLLLIVHLSYFLFATYIIAILKQAFQQSRPIWYDSRLSNWQWFCPKDFGNPSGHSFAVILLFQPIISDSIGYWKYRPWTIILVILCVMIPISRMYLGVHSANQVLFGLSMGITSLILYKYIYQKALYELYWQFLTGTKQKLKFLGVFLLHIAVIGIPIVFYYSNKTNRPMLQKDINNLNLQCGTNLTGQKVQASMLTACAIGCIPFGLIYGFILLMNRPGYKKYLLGRWQYETKLKILIKLGVYILSAGIPFVIFFLIGTLALHEYPLGQYFFLCAAITGAGLGLAFFAPIITSKCNIMKFIQGPVQNHIQEVAQREQRHEKK